MRKSSIFKFFLLPIGSVIVTAASIPPQDAKTNLGAWAQYFGMDEVPSILATQAADNWGLLIGLLLIAISIYFIFNRKNTSKLGPEYSSPAIPPVEETNDAVDATENIKLTVSTYIFCSGDKRAFDEAISKNPQCVIHLSKQEDDVSYCSTGGITSESPGYEYQASKLYICEITINNRSDIQVFNISLPANTICRRAIPTENGCKSGEVLLEKKMLFDLHGLSIEPGQSVTIWIENFSDLVLTIGLYGFLTGQVDSTGETRIPFILIKHPIPQLATTLFPWEHPERK